MTNVLAKTVGPVIGLLVGLGIGVAIDRTPKQPAVDPEAPYILMEIEGRDGGRLWFVAGKDLEDREQFGIGEATITILIPWESHASCEGGDCVPCEDYEGPGCPIPPPPPGMLEGKLVVEPGGSLMPAR